MIQLGFIHYIIQEHIRKDVEEVVMGEREKFSRKKQRLVRKNIFERKLRDN